MDSDLEAITHTVTAIDDSVSVSLTVGLCPYSTPNIRSYYSCVCAHVCSMYKSVGVCTVCVSTCRGWRLTLDVLLNSSPPFFETESGTWKLAGQ